MGDGTTPSLRAGHRRALGLDTVPAEKPEPKTYHSVEKLFKDDRAELLKTIPPWVIKKSWFALAHLVLEPGSIVVDIGCRDGSMAYTMSVLAPTMHFVGIDKNPDRIKKAREIYTQPNLEYQVGDVLTDALPDDKADAIICNFVLHEIFSNNGFNQRLVRQTLRQCQKYLKPGGILLIRDYAEPNNPDDMVLIEMPDARSKGPKPEDMSEPDLLIWYSEHATMREDSHEAGFFLEELPARFPRTRLFRLAHKWAYEFVMRKDQRNEFQDELPKEYTFYNERDYQKTLNAMGLRVLYSAPHWDDAYTARHFEKNFRLLDENGTPLGTPATSFIVVAQKIDERDSLLLSERRKTKNQETAYHIKTYRNEIDGRLIEIVSRDQNITEIIPFSLMAGGRLVVYLHEGVPRGLVNAVPRAGRNLDGKFWSGHLTEAISVDTEVIKQMEGSPTGAADVIKFIKDTTNLKVSVGQSFVEGPGYFPNPRFIDERIETRFISVEPAMGRYVPQFVRDDITGFASTGAIRAFDAQSIMNAISVGLLPSGNLEIQLLMLFSMLDLKVMDWSETPMVLKEEEPSTTAVKVSDILKKTGTKDKRYKEMRGTIGKIKVEKSVFVDEGMDNDGANRGLAARDIDFVINENTGQNVAVILPLSKQHSGEVMAGVIVDFLPIPERYSGNGEIVSLPTLPLPKEITNMDMAKKYIAEKFEIKVEQVSKMGEPYYSHIGVTPQRIFPFAINCPITKMAQPRHGMNAYDIMKNLGRMHWKELFERYDIDMLKVCGRMNKRLFGGSELGFNWGWEMPMVPKYAQAPFTTGQVVDMRMQQGAQPLTAPTTTGGTTKKNSDAFRQLPKAMPATEIAGLYSTGFLAAAKSTDKTGRSSGGKSGGGGAASGKRGFKPRNDPNQKKDLGTFLKPEPNK